MSGLLSMIGMQAELDYLIGDFPAYFGDTPLAIPKGNIPSVSDVFAEDWEVVTE